MIFDKVRNATITDTNFYNNTATKYGSVLFAQQTADPGQNSIYFSNCEFIANNAQEVATI